MSSSVRIQRLAPAWSVKTRPFSTGGKPSLWLEISNQGTMPGSFVPLALEVPDFRVEFERLEVHLIAGFQNSLINPGRAVVFELIADLKEPLGGDETVQLDLLYAGISPQTDEWHSKDRDSAVLNLPVILTANSWEEER